MELTDLLNAGGIAGLIGNAIYSLLQFVFPRMRITDTDLPSSGQHWLSLLAHLATGLILGLVFWLSWGFTAIVGVPWWQRGLIFALATWLLFCVPIVSAQLLSLHVTRKSTAVIALEWLLTFTLAGLACAWSWGHRS